MGKGFLRELSKWYMHKPEFFPENKMHKILVDFEIRTDHLISPWWPGLVIIHNKKVNLPKSGLAAPADRKTKTKENKKRDKYFELTRELKKIYWT